MKYGLAVVDPTTARRPYSTTAKQQPAAWIHPVAADAANPCAPVVF
jgi:hypothetical protein